jgi:hypothetical protein
LANKAKRASENDDQSAGESKRMAQSVRDCLIGRQRGGLGDGLTFADDLLILEGDCQESPDEFGKLHHALRRDLCPRGCLEEMLVETVASCIWRKKRLLRFERGKTEQAQIRARIGHFESDHKDWLFRCAMADGSPSVKTCSGFSEGIDYLLDLLERFTAEIEEKGHLSQERMKTVWLTWRKGDLMNDGVGFWVYFFNSQLTGEHPMKEELDEARCRKGLLGILAAERERLEAVKELVTEELADRAEAHIDSLSIPDADTVKCIRDYGAAIGREMYSALDQLERLQRARLGDVAYTIMRFAATADEAEPELVQKVGELRLTVSSPIKAPRIGLTRARAR